MSRVINMNCPGDQRQTAASALPKATLCPVAPRFQHNTLGVHAKQQNHLVIAAHIENRCITLPVLSSSIII
jgi:hypothetical protein